MMIIINNILNDLTTSTADIIIITYTMFFYLLKVIMYLKYLQ